MNWHDISGTHSQMDSADREAQIERSCNEVAADYGENSDEFDLLDAASYWLLENGDVKSQIDGEYNRYLNAMNCEIERRNERSKKYQHVQGTSIIFCGS